MLGKKSLFFKLAFWKFINIAPLSGFSILFYTGQGWTRTLAHNWQRMQSASVFSFLPSLSILFLKCHCDDGCQRKLWVCFVCVCIYVYLPHTLSFFQIRMLSKPFSWRASVTLVLGRSYEVTNNWGCALCGFLPPPILCIVQILHDLFADGSSIKAFKKNCLRDELFKTQNAAPLLERAKAWCWAQRARCTGLSVRLPNQTNYPDSWDSIFDVNKWLGQSPHFPALASFTLKPFFRKASLQFKRQLHFRKTQARLVVLRLLKFQLCWKVFSAWLICLIVQDFPKTPSAFLLAVSSGPQGTKWTQCWNLIF